MSPRRTDDAFRSAHGVARKLVDGLERVIRGKTDVLEMIVMAMLAPGHVLIEDVPGLGKTTLAKTVAHLVARSGGRGGGRGGAKTGPVTFRRIQFTPDLLPYDITGVDVFDPGRRGFVFAPGPVFTSVLLADEINRTTPKVQSALLEVMAEGQVTVGNRTRVVDPFFFVIATQNPVEIEGVYPLPLAQLDRFLLRLRVGYPERAIEESIVRDDPAATVLPGITPVCGRDEVLAARRRADGVFFDGRLLSAVVGVTAGTRSHPGIELGASPRASIMLARACRALALVRGRDHVIDQDLVDLSPSVLAHRLRLKDVRTDADSLVREIVMVELARLTG
ncbi:MAG: AAA family ATPase [Spirochaetes bacterium]|nr:AAA family ATPase [Spirochaetota bacterium]